MVRQITYCLGAATLLLCFNGCDDEFYSSSSDDTFFPQGGDESEEPSSLPVLLDGNEKELEASFLAPVVTGSILWSVNPSSNKVTALDTSTNQMQVLKTGQEPREIIQLQDGSSTSGGVLVLNRKSHDASIFYTAKDDEKTSELGEEGPRVPVHAGASAWATGNKGDFAIAWSRVSDALLSPNDGYQDITVLDFRQTAKTKAVGATRLAVGFRPESVTIAQGEERAVVVSQPGVSVIDLKSAEGPRLERQLFLANDALSNRQVNISPDGKYALASRSITADLEVINLDTGEETTLNFGAPITDLDISKDGSKVVVVMRGSVGDPAATEGAAGANGQSATPSYISIIPLPDGLEDPTLIQSITTDEVFGSATVAENGSRSLLYSNGISSELVGVLTHTPLALRVVNVRSQVRAAFVGESGQQGLVLCRKDNRDTFALLSLNAEAPTRIKETDAPIAFIALSDSLKSAWVTTQSKASGGATALLGTYPSLSIDSYPLPSAPLAAGFITETSMAHASQTHPGGRVTLLNLAEKQATTITGFELSSEVVE